MQIIMNVVMEWLIVIISVSTLLAHIFATVELAMSLQPEVTQILVLVSCHNPFAGNNKYSPVI